MSTAEDALARDDSWPARTVLELDLVRQLTRTLWVLGSLAFLTLLYRERYFFHDDAFISLRYVTNFVEHGELAWNLGERVEGYTNFLHILMASALVAAGIDPQVAVRLLNIGSALTVFGAFIVASRTLLSGREHQLQRAAAGFMLLASAPIALWVLGGLEPVMAAGFVAVAWAVLVPSITGPADPRRLVLAGVLAACAALTRPDSVLLVAGAGAALLFRPQTPWITRCRDAFVLGASTALPIMIHGLWRWSYYGDIVPNTFHAKVGIPMLQRVSAGVRYLDDALIWHPIILAAAALTVLLLLRRRLSPVAFGLATSLAVFAAYVVWAGGDHMAGGRLFVPAVGPAALLLVIGLGAAPRKFVGSAVLVCATAATLSYAAFPNHKMDPAAWFGTLAGNFLRDTFPPGTLVALHTAGSTPYMNPQLQFIDMLGLNDRAIAMRDPVPMLTKAQRLPGHAKGDGAYVLSRKPDVIILGVAQGRDISKPDFLSDVELSRSPEFYRCYRKHVAPLPVSSYMEARRPPHRKAEHLIYYQRICSDS